MPTVIILCGSHFCYRINPLKTLLTSQKWNAKKLQRKEFKIDFIRLAIIRQFTFWSDNSFVRSTFYVEISKFPSSSPSLVNFTNILRTAFAPISLRQKSTNLQYKYRKAALKTFEQKAARKMLMKLTPLLLIILKCFPVSRIDMSKQIFFLNVKKRFPAFHLNARQSFSVILYIRSLLYL